GGCQAGGRGGRPRRAGGGPGRLRACRSHARYGGCDGAAELREIAEACDAVDERLIIMADTDRKLSNGAARIDFATHPSRYYHWKLSVDGDVAQLLVDGDQNS